MNTKLRGSWGEALALNFLKNKGYTPLAVGYRSRFGEIDLIVRDAKYVVFAEVKVRKSDRFAEAREFVDYKKQARLRKTAQLWLARHDPPLQPRFDVIEIYAPMGINTNNPRINHIEDAF